MRGRRSFFRAIAATTVGALLPRQRADASIAPLELADVEGLELDRALVGEVGDTYLVSATSEPLAVLCRNATVSLAEGDAASVRVLGDRSLELVSLSRGGASRTA